MSKEFIAELHDIGKLVNKKGLKNFQLRGHTFENFDFTKYNLFKPTSPSWYGQYHHFKNFKDPISNWQDIDAEYRPNVFLLIIADHLASSISRAMPQIGKADESESEGVCKLWNNKFFENEKEKGKHWAAFQTDDDIREIFKIIDEIKSPKDFLEKYHNNLILTPEDKSIPRNVTSLFTHVELVGKIYRVLHRHVIIDKNYEYLELDGKQVKSIPEAEGGTRTIGENNVDKGLWQARFIECYIKFPHSFVRLQDINLLVKRNDFIKSFVNSYPDYTIFHTSDFLFLFLPMNINLEEMFKDFLNNGFIVEYVETIADLGILSSNLSRKLLKARKTNREERLKVLDIRNTEVYRKILMSHSIPEEIQPPICDICQMQPAAERIKENIREWICDKCYQIREEGERFKYPEEWTDQKVVWFKFNINHDKLEEWLQWAFSRYIDSLKSNSIDKQTAKDEFRSLACHIDFIKDYNKMVEEFWQKLDSAEIMKPISDYEELGVCKYSGKIVNKIIDVFNTVYDSYFPNCNGDNQSPISLSLSISHIKYPVREHWRFFENPKGFLNIRNHNIFEDTYTKQEVQWLLDMLSKSNIESTHFLYKLIGLYDGLSSDINITVEILNNKDRHPLIYKLYSKFKITPKRLLNFIRVIDDGNKTT